MKMIVRSQVIFENNGMLLAYLLCYIIRARPHEKMCGINFEKTAMVITASPVETSQKNSHYKNLIKTDFKRK